MPWVEIGGRQVEAKRKFLLTDEAAQVLGIGEATVRQMVRKGQLRDVSHTHRMRIDPEDLAAEIEKRIEIGKLTDAALLELAVLVGTHRDGGDRDG